MACRRRSGGLPCQLPATSWKAAARSTEDDFLRFLDQAYGSSRELPYQLGLAMRLGCLTDDGAMVERATELSKVLNSLIRAVRGTKAPKGMAADLGLRTSDCGL